MDNSGPAKSFEKITENQGFPGGHEVDPTPLITFVFPVFFGMMFADFGHGLVVTVFSLILRSRKDRNIRAWGNIFLAAGISAMVFGILLGEVFGLDLGQIVPLPAFLPVVTHGQGPLFYQANLNYAGVLQILTIALLIGIAHIITGLSLDIYQAVRSGEKFELLVEKIPTLVMYVSGLGFGLAFIQANFSFNILGTPLGLISTIVVLAVAIEVIVWKGVATIMGRIHEESVPMAFVGGLIELLVKISEFLSNTISYARLGILLLVHAALLLALNKFFALPVYEAIVPVVIFNIMIMVLEGLIVYIQDLRLHLYEFFTKFYEGYGTPFRKLLPDRVRTKVAWT
jgi:V/A-type H+-transporting ATPase subunit I